MIEKIIDFIRREKLDVYDIAVITPEGAEEAYITPCNPASENYSVTKLFISTMAGKMICDGRLKADGRITETLAPYLEFGYDPVWDKVTLMDCLTHKAGIDRGVLDIDCDDVSQYPTDDYLKMVFDCPPTHMPGEYEYRTDVVHYLVSRCISAVTGKPADTVIYGELLKPMCFRQTYWARDPYGYTIGSSGSCMRASDVVKLGWLYLDNGKWNGEELVPAEWIRTAEELGADIVPEGQTSFLRKGGMNGQIVMYSRDRNMAVAWHSNSPDSRVNSTATYIESMKYEAR